MATGYEHYKEAERLVKPTDLTGLPYNRMQPSSPDIAAAQVHATLAAAAATVELALSMQADNGVMTEWIEAVTHDHLP